MDAGLPFIVTITEDGKQRSFILLRIGEYPTEEYGQFMSQLETVFDNWEDCTHNNK